MIISIHIFGCDNGQEMHIVSPKGTLVPQAGGGGPQWESKGLSLGPDVRCGVSSPQRLHDVATSTLASQPARQSRGCRRGCRRRWLGGRQTGLHWPSNPAYSSVTAQAPEKDTPYPFDPSLTEGSEQ